MTFHFIFDDITPSFWIHYWKRRGPYPTVKSVRQETDLDDVFLEKGQFYEMICARLCESYLDRLPWFLLVYIFDRCGLSSEDLYHTYEAFRASDLEFLRQSISGCGVPDGVSNALYCRFGIICLYRISCVYYFSF